MAEERTDHLRDAIHSARDSAAVGTPAGQGTVPLLPPPPRQPRDPGWSGLDPLTVLRRLQPGGADRRRTEP